MKPTITFKNREQFNDVSDWIFGPDDVMDIGYSDMIIMFKDNKTLRVWEGCILWNHIKEEDYTIDLDETEHTQNSQEY